MKINRHSKELDELLNKRVRLTFYDSSTAEGVLIWNEGYKAPRYLMYEGYYICLENGQGFHFKKSHVIKVEQI